MNGLIGPLIMLLSTITYSLLTPLVKKANQDIPPFSVMAISMFALFIASLILSIAFENVINLKYLSTNRNMVLILIIVGLINTLGFWLAILAFKYMPIWQQAMFNLLIPVLAGIVAYFILGEALSLNYLSA